MPHALQTLTAACFLACSWLWCIGLYLPIILLRNFGWPGWLAFAIPNVLGAAAVGLALRRPGASQEFVRRREPWLRAFSLWTVAFHAFFLALPLVMVAISPTSSSPELTALSALALAAIVSALGLALSIRAWTTAAPALLLLSFLLFFGASITGSTMSRTPSATGAYAPIALAYAAPAIALGFLTCPFLDLTLHATRQRLPGRAGTTAFILAFALLFPLLITGSLIYGAAWVQNGEASYYILGHMVAQSLFTVGAHSTALKNSGVRFRWTLLAILAGSLLAWIALRAESIRMSDAYLVLLAAYGLAFPALVWASVALRRDALRTWSLITLVAIAAGALPFWMGFLERRWWALLPGVAIVLAAPLLAPLLRAKGARAA